jgi:hypothetical protein
MKANLRTESEILARRPGLAVILVGDNGASQVYVRNKVADCRDCGIECFDFYLGTDTKQEELLALIAELNGREDVDGILVQLPLPAHLEERPVLEAIDPMKDVDAFHPDNMGRILRGDARFKPCTPAGVMELLHEYGIDPASIAGFLNERLYSDCHSKLLYNVNGKKAMAVSVEREFTPEIEAYHCANNIEQYRAPIKLTGKPFEVELHRGSWGRWNYDFVGGMRPRKSTSLKPGDVVNGALIVAWGDDYIRAARLTPSGKPARKFYKYGTLEEHCGQFHDYNF